MQQTLILIKQILIFCFKFKEKSLNFRQNFDRFAVFTEAKRNI